MQLAGTQLSNTSALVGNDIATFPDFPAEIRAPQVVLAGVSGWDHFASREIFTPGDRLDALVCMNAAALVTNLDDLAPGGILIVDSDGFGKRDLDLAGCKSDPLLDERLSRYQVFKVEMTRLTRLAVKETGLSTKDADRCRNFFAMGLVFWLYDRPVEPTERFILDKFGRRPTLAEANRRALHAGYNYGINTEALAARYSVDPARLRPGTYRNITGNQALAWGLLAAAKLSGCPLFYGTYPITPASDILHELSRLKKFGVRTFQAEDEIAAVTSCIGAAFGGAMAVTGSNGPGIALKAEAMGLGVMTELPMIIINVHSRAGPARECPQDGADRPEHAQPSSVATASARCRCSPRSPAVASMSPARRGGSPPPLTPVIVLGNAYVANGSEPWQIPALAISTIAVQHIPKVPTTVPSSGLCPQRAARAAVGLAGHPGPDAPPRRPREAEPGSGAVSYDPENHRYRVNSAPGRSTASPVTSPPRPSTARRTGALLVVGWGGTTGAGYCGPPHVGARRVRGPPPPAPPSPARRSGRNPLSLRPGAGRRTEHRPSSAPCSATGISSMLGD